MFFYFHYVAVVIFGAFALVTFWLTLFIFTMQVLLLSTMFLPHLRRP